ncbi:MAG: hypothetical protein KC464_09170, partial [Myxococcales bacterium]|nr:hypothetical protein [Myxococcales bacterium]
MGMSGGPFDDFEEAFFRKGEQLVEEGVPEEAWTPTRPAERLGTWVRGHRTTAASAAGAVVLVVVAWVAFGGGGGASAAAAGARSTTTEPRT